MEAYIRGPTWYAVEVAGESAHQDALEAACGGRSFESRNFRTQAVLVVGDEESVQVEINGTLVGRLRPADAAAYCTQLARTAHAGSKVWCEAIIAGGWDRGVGDIGRFGIKLDLPPAVCDLDIVDGPPQWPDGSRKQPRRPEKPEPKLRIVCGSCGRGIRAPLSYAGRTASCPHCAAAVAFP